MEDYNKEYNKIIESLGVRFIKANNIQVLKPLTIESYYDVENTILVPHSGSISFEMGDVKGTANQGDMIFIPGGKTINITYGDAEERIKNEEFITKREQYLAAINSRELTPGAQHYSYISFEAKVFDSVNFFNSLDIPPFIITDNTIIGLINEIVKEIQVEDVGKNRVIKINTEKMVVMAFRYILKERLFVEQLATNITYFKDPRLINIFNYIKENLGEDLSNKVLANVANVSEDYVGQYFKVLTGINPQDYIEYQRMEKSVNLLRTSKKSIREIGREVGYKDTAYFCRRFKMMFGIPAGKMRRRESLMNI